MDGDDPVGVHLTTLLRHGEDPLPGQVLAGDGLGAVENALRLPLVDDVAAELAGPRTDVHQPVGGTDGLLVVLDDDEGVADVPQVLECGDEAGVVALVQADRRLVEDVEDAGQTGTDLCRQPDALRLSTGQGAGGAGHGQVVQADVDEEPQSRLDLLEDASGDHLVTGVEGEAVEEAAGVLDAHRGDVGDGLLPRLGVDGDLQDLRAQPGTATGRTRHFAHVAEVAFLLVVALRLVDLAVQVVQDALERRGVLPRPTVAVAVADGDLLGVPGEHRLALLLRQFRPAGVRVDAEVLRECGEQLVEVAVVRGGCPGRDRADERGVLVRDDQGLVDLEFRAETVAGRAGTVGAVEGEAARLQLVDGQGVAVGAGHVLGEPTTTVRVIILETDEVEDHATVGQAEGGLHGLGEPLLLGRLDLQPVDDDVDVVLDLLLQLGRIGEAVGLPVDEDAGVALGGEILEEVDELTFAGAHHRSEDLELQPFLHPEDLVDDLLRCLTFDPRPALGAVGDARAGEQQSQVVVDLGDGTHGRPGIPVRRLLVDGHRRRQALDELDVRFVHLTEELARVGGQRLDVASLAFREDGVEGEGGLAGAGQSGEDDHPVPGQVNVHPLEVVLAGAAHGEDLSHR